MAKTPTARHRGSEWGKLAAQRVAMGRAIGEPCRHCGKPIDYSLKGNHKWGPTADHSMPLAMGGDILVPLDMLYVAHKSCNSRHGGRLSAIKRWKPTEDGSIPRKHGSRGVMYVQPELRKIELPEFTYSESQPRLFTPQHPDAVGTLADEWAEWLLVEHSFELRPWQKLVLDRALEIDANGRLVWRNIIVSTPRQSGKSLLIWAIALCRNQFADRFVEPQEVVHVANNLAAARRIHQRAWRWAQQSGIRIYKAFGQERLLWPDGSHWSLVSSQAIWGWSASLALVDEAWDVHPDVVNNALKPTMVEREQPQLWLFSTANDECTPTIPVERERAGNGSTMIAEWSAPRNADVFDPEVWRLASPHWTKQRMEMMTDSVRTPGFKRQWLNIWPDIRSEIAWSDSWPDLRASKPVPPYIAAIESAFDRSCYGIAIASPNASGADLEAKVVHSEEDAMAWLLNRNPVVLMAGASIKDRFQGPWITYSCTARETRSATPWMIAAIRDKKLTHNHDAEVAAQISATVITDVETGPVFSARRSSGPIPVSKAIAWASTAAAEDWYSLASTPAIW